MNAGSVVALCRAGFESEALADLARLAAHGGLALDATRVAPGHVSAAIAPTQWAAWLRAMHELPPIFARSISVGTGPLALQSATGGRRVDRITPLLVAIAGLPAHGERRARWCSVWVEYPDTNEGKSLSTLARALESRLVASLRDTGHVADDASRRLHVFLPDGDSAHVGETLAGDGSAWPMGIARLRMPREAPSRSTLKLAEAIDTFLGGSASRLMRPGMRAVDLGAAPGGWTWQLVSRGLRVTAIDNGPLKGSVAQDPLVTHLAQDGFRFRPKRPVDWLVCDMVEQPRRVADLVAGWIADGAARRAIFNLKLPMRRRYDEVNACERRIGEILTGAGSRFSLRLKHLYHDREEVTGYLARED